MGFGIGSEGMLTGAYFSALAVSGAILFMVVRILLLRFSLRLFVRRSARFLVIWRPLLADFAITPRPCKEIKPPPLARQDHRRFVALWLDMQELLTDEAHERLNHVARCLDLHRIVRHYLQRKNARHRVAAILSLGHLGDRASWSALETLMHDANPLISVVAARSLMQIDSAKAAPLVFAELLHRQDWPVERLDLVFHQTLSPDLADRLLTAQLDDCDDATARRLSPYVGYMSHEARDAMLFSLLTRSHSDRLTSRVLRQVENPQCLELVRRYTSYPRWHVRMQAVAALGRIGCREEDIALLHDRLGDEQWWVRYRAAQALVKLLGNAPEELRAIARQHADPFARRILGQVLREEGLAHD